MSKTKSQKLELTWIGKGEEPKLEPRILIENPEYSYGDPNSENMLIHGDNLLALKALEQDYAGKVKCIYIDPPYNTGNAFEHYDDGVEHSEWLNLMTPRLRLLRDLLSTDGSIWISIDDDESHYLKVLCDEIFGRQNFVSNVIWEKKFSPQNDAKWLSDSHDHILVYAKSKDIWRPNLLPRTEEMDARYKNPDNDPRGPWTSGDLLRKDVQKTGLYTIITPSGKRYDPPAGRSWRMPEYRFLEAVEDDRIWFGADKNNVPRIKRFLSQVKQGVVSMTLWFRKEVGDNDSAAKEIRKLFPKDPFGTPKPEKLIERILFLGSNQGDLVLDSFLGSGTTAAVAHKMGRRYIGVELGEHAITHCYPRLKQVVDGEQGGISKSVGWKGGGGFKFFTLAPSLLKEDRFGNLVINQEYNPDMLAAAMAKQEGFKYVPDEAIFWKQGRSMERDFIFTTTQFLTVEALDRIQEEMKPEETLLICCKAYQPECENRHSAITIKKIPTLLLGKCEFGRDDYSLNIVSLPKDDSIEENEETDLDLDEPSEIPNKKEKPSQPGLFD
ncbi:site-specific DNA-methyltransferase [Algoriphagus formosus]|uniref:site-specific DNA-methyltransferase (adenine-specific) n=1 Tax=Algoriphagus formosus TaxID=2007308 RepID=A0A4R5V8P2_9BACT|nr:site-specific DNA-methyltransferase [Algoriphagus aquimaris]TDK47916.1 site-specific DNA-methyltransferase [Algoriphagus aquimaris]